MKPNDPMPVGPIPSGGRQMNLMMVVAIFFGIGTLLFGGLSIIEYSTAQKATSTLNDQVKAAKQAAYEQGLADQKDADAKAAEAPFRAYVAPGLFGAITIRFPKNWSSTVSEDQSADTQIDLVAHPDFVKKTTGDDLYALHFQLIRQTFDVQLKHYQELEKQKKVKISDGHAAGIAGKRVDGKVDNKHDIILILVPVRDKTALFWTDDRKYSEEFTQIIAQSLIAP